MKFEVVDEKNQTVMNTFYFECIPDKNQIDTMFKSGYKIKVDNKVLSKKKIESFLIRKGTNNYENTKSNVR